MRTDGGAGVRACQVRAVAVLCDAVALTAIDRSASIAEAVVAAPAEPTLVQRIEQHLGVLAKAQQETNHTDRMRLISSAPICQ